MRYLLLSTLGLLFLLSGCGATIKNTWVKEGYTPKSFKNILVLNISKNKNTRSAYEKSAVVLLENEGFGASTSLELFPLDEDFEKVSSKTIQERIASGNFDAVLVSALVDVDVRNKSDYYFENNINNYNTWNSPYKDYIKHNYMYAHTSDFDREERQYLVESRLYDVKEGNKEDAIIWSGNTKISNPTDLESVAKQYAQLVVHTLIKDQIIKP